MPAKYLLISKKANKEALKLPVRIQIKVGKAFREIKSNPTIGAKLSGELDRNFKYRIGDYRIVYSFDHSTSTVEITKIEHRQGVYK